MGRPELNLGVRLHPYLAVEVGERDLLCIAPLATLHRARQVRRRVDVLVVEAQNHVSNLDAKVVGRGSGLDRRNHGAANVRGNRVLLPHALRELPDIHTEVRFARMQRWGRLLIVRLPEVREVRERDLILVVELLLWWLLLGELGSL